MPKGSRRRLSAARLKKKDVDRVLARVLSGSAWSKKLFLAGGGKHTDKRRKPPRYKRPADELE